MLRNTRLSIGTLNRQRDRIDKIIKISVADDADHEFDARASAFVSRNSEIKYKYESGEVYSLINNGHNIFSNCSCRHVDS